MEYFSYLYPEIILNVDKPCYISSILFLYIYGLSTLRDCQDFIQDIKNKKSTLATIYSRKNASLISLVCVSLSFTLSIYFYHYYSIFWLLLLKVTFWDKYNHYKINNTLIEKFNNLKNSSKKMVFLNNSQYSELKYSQLHQLVINKKLPQRTYICCFKDRAKHYIWFWSCILNGCPVAVIDGRHLRAEECLSTQTIINKIDTLKDQHVVILTEKSLDYFWDFLNLDIPILDVDQPMPDLDSLNINSNVIFYQFTSGSTGKPKCIPYTLKAIDTFLENYSSKLSLDSNNTSLVWVNTEFIVHTLRLHFKDIWLDSSQIITDVSIFFSPNLQNILDQVKCLYLPNFLIKKLLKLNKKLNLTKIDQIMISGEYTDPDIVSEFMSKYNLKNNLFHCYGLSETCGGIVFHQIQSNSIYHYENQKFYLAGKPIENVAIKIKKLDQSPLGKILIKGAPIITKYFKQLDTIWLDTGDLGLFTKNGDLVIIGREKDRLVINGIVYYSTQIEVELKKHISQIQECSVTSQYNPEDGTDQLVIRFWANASDINKKIKYICSYKLNGPVLKF